MSQSFWKVYKAKVLQTFNTEEDGETHEESDTAEIINTENMDNGDEGLNMSHLARKSSADVCDWPARLRTEFYRLESQVLKRVQGAFGWRSVSSLFTKEEEHITDEKIEHRPEQAAEQSPSSHPSHPPENLPQKSPSALWDVFSSRWHQSSAEHSEARGVLSEPPPEQHEAQPAEETPFKWSFLTSKLADLRSKSD